ncbi:MAG: deoxyribodipyrimidine photolyase [Proteobacteria bacterium]|nr:deoxyribodipyrimidine photolyase [Pseudomonadota bacterium]
MLEGVDPRRVSRSGAPVRASGSYVLYWMIAARRTRWSHGLQHAVRWSQELGKPLLVFEPLRAGSRWSSERVHRFVLQGMRDNAARLGDVGVGYYPYVEPVPGHGQGLLEALATEASVVVTDAFPTHFLPRMVDAARARLDVRLEVVDGNGVIPMSAPDRDFTVAHSFRRWIQKNVGELWKPPVADPLVAGLQGAQVRRSTLNRWPAAGGGRPTGLERLPDCLAGTPSAVDQVGGARAASEGWNRFREGGLARYHCDRSHPDDDVQSGLSTWLHFGHIGVFEVLEPLLKDWDPEAVPKATGKREGWWGLPAATEAFLDQIVTWRELGYVQAFRDPEGFCSFEGLPAWARTTLQAHQGDERPYDYTLQQLRDAQTHDALWNAAQRELVRTGRIHNALRMLWGKNVLAWTRSPEQAYAVLEELNNAYALDGRNPNSYSGIGWALGRFDRAWGPERPIYGKVRYMTSASSRKKWRLKGYLERFAA